MFGRTMKTERLLLRNWRMQDLEDYEAFATDPQVMLPSGSMPITSHRELNRRFGRLLGDLDAYAIVLCELGRVIGKIHFQTDFRRHQANSISIGYELNRAFWGNGYMPEALNAMVCYAFERKRVDLVAIAHFSENQKSKRVIEKCGFRHEGHVPQAFRRGDGTVFDEEVYHLLRSDYCEDPARRTAVVFR